MLLKRTKMKLSTFQRLPVRGITAEEVLSLWHNGQLFVNNDTVEENAEETLARCQQEALAYVRAINVYTTKEWASHVELLWQRIVKSDGFALGFVMKKKHQMNRYYVLAIVFNLQTLGVYLPNEEVSQLRLHLTLENIRQKNGIFKNWGQYAISGAQRKALQALMQDFKTSLK